MMTKLKERLGAVYRVFGSPDNTLLAQMLIAFLMFSISTVIWGEKYQNDANIDAWTMTTNAVDQ
jgi:hypothetical protein